MNMGSFADIVFTKKYNNDVEFQGIKDNEENRRKEKRVESVDYHSKK